MYWPHPGIVLLDTSDPGIRGSLGYLRTGRLDWECNKIAYLSFLAGRLDALHRLFEICFELG